MLAIFCLFWGLSHNMPESYWLLGFIALLLTSVYD